MRPEEKQSMTVARLKQAAEPSARSAVEPAASHEEMVNAIRMLAADAVQKAKSGHPGLPMGMATAATVLWTRFLKFDPTKPDWEDRDRFVLSAGHGSMLLYSLLYLTGYEEITIDEIRNFRQLGSKTPGHPEYEVSCGIETTTGPLAQGLGNAVGMALAERLRNARWGDDIVDHYTYCIVGDGCLMEGLSQEAISFAGFHRLSKLIVLWDDNRISIDGPTSLAIADNQLARFEACGWDAEVVDGDDTEAVAARHRQGARFRQAVADRLPHRHRQGCADQGRHRGDARRAARRGGGGGRSPDAELALSAVRHPAAHRSPPGARSASAAWASG